jgi:uncharacterized protein YigA (DUF484 family)
MPASSSPRTSVTKTSKPKVVAVSAPKSVKKTAGKAVVKKISAPQVWAYLKAHPQFFETHKEDLAELVVPAKAGNLLSLHAHKAQRVDKKAENLKTRYTQLVDAARQNAKVTDSIHAAVLGALACGAAAGFRKYLQNRTDTGFMGILDLDACHLATGVEEAEMELLCPQGMALGPADPVLHRPLFGAHIVDMKSVCLMRMNADTLLVLGSYDATRFHAGQSTELAQFLRDALALHWEHIKGA